MQYTRESWLQAKTYINISLPLMSILFTWLIIHVHKLFYTGIQSQAILNCAPLILQFEPICNVHVYCAHMMFSSEFQQAVRSNKVKVSLSAMKQTIRQFHLYLYHLIYCEFLIFYMINWFYNSAFLLQIARI